jgi:hypothetical protein
MKITFGLHQFLAVGALFRAKENLAKTSKDIAEAIAIYAKEYLKLKPDTSPVSIIKE